ncbi:MAG: hypothetical protein ACYTEZ_19305 [Planctomycetota bacterium]|jgi:hypothetical protein
MRMLAALAVVVALGACSESTEKAGGWKRGTVAEGRLSFEMPGIFDVAHTDDGTGDDAVHEEKASCEFDARHYSVSVLDGAGVGKEMGGTPQEHARWIKLFLVGCISTEESDVEEEGDWTQGPLKGKWLRAGLAPRPGKRTVPVFNWLYAAPWGDKTVLVQFVATQASYENSLYRASVDRLRERFLASVTVE